MQNLSGGFVIPIETVISWLEKIYNLIGYLFYESKCYNDGLAKLENAIKFLKSQVLSDEDLEIVNMVSALFKEEMNGNLKPPPSIKKLYIEIISKNQIKESHE